MKCVFVSRFQSGLSLRTVFLWAICGLASIACVPDLGAVNWVTDLEPVPGRISAGARHHADLDILAQYYRQRVGVEGVVVLRQGILDFTVERAQTAALLASLRVDNRFAWAEPLYSIGDEIVRVTGSIMIKLAEDEEFEALRSLNKQFDVVAVRSKGASGVWYALDFPSDRSVGIPTLLSVYLEHQSVESGVPVYFRSGLSYTPNDPLFQQQWDLENIGQVIGDPPFSGTPDADIDATGAWNISTGQPSIVVAIIDTGVDHSHPDLDDNLISGADIAGTASGSACLPTTIPGDATCDGWFYENHGTACAGTAAAEQDSWMGISGLAPNVRIMPIRVGCSGADLNSEWVVDSILWAWTHGADVLNLSFGFSDHDQAIIDAIDEARILGRNGRGAVVVAAAGNTNNNGPPNPLDDTAWARGSIGVGASSPCDEVKRRGPVCSCDGCWVVASNFSSNVGQRLDILAPGVFMTTTDNTSVCGHTDNDYNSEWGGTSAASPLAAGLAALLLSVDNTLPADGVRGFIADTAEQVKVLTGSSWTQVPDGTFHEQSGWGRINAYGALLAVSNRDPNLVHVNVGNSNAENPNQVKETGTSQANGFNTLREGILALADGGQLVLGAGEYHANELSTPMTLTATGGFAVISALP